MTALPDYAEALRSRSAVLTRRLGEERQNQKRAADATVLAEAEVLRLAAETAALRLALKSERERMQAWRARIEGGKLEFLADKKEVVDRRLQLAFLSDEIARAQERADAKVAEALERAHQAASRRRFERESSWRAEVGQRGRDLERVGAEVGRLSQGLALLAAEQRRQQSRSASVQLLAGVERVAHARQAEACRREARREAEQLAEQRARQLREHRDVQLARLAADAACDRQAAVEARQQEEAADEAEAEELRASAARNLRRAERAEREALEHEEALRAEERAALLAAAERSTAHLAASGAPRAPARPLSELLKAAPANLRAEPLHAEFPILGTLQALEQELLGLTASAAKGPRR